MGAAVVVVVGVCNAHRLGQNAIAVVVAFRVVVIEFIDGGRLP